MNAEQRLSELQKLISEYNDVRFSAGEQGMSEEEIEGWRADLWRKITDISGATETCILCGTKYVGLGNHECQPIEDEVKRWGNEKRS